MTKEEYAAKAVMYKHSGCNCCQAVVKALTENTDADGDKLNAIASGFGMGMGCMEATCGALVGANIVLGLMGKGRCAKNLLARFQELCGGTICGELKGKYTGIVLASCDDCVKNAALAAAEILDI